MIKKVFYKMMLNLLKCIAGGFLLGALWIIAEYILI